MAACSACWSRPVLFARRRGLAFFELTDALAVATPIGLFLGRIANFINAELWGRVTDVPWARGLPHRRAGAAPSQPALRGRRWRASLLFAVMLWFARRPYGPSTRGLLSGVFLIGYALARITVELFREPDVQIGYLAGGITMGQLLSLPMLAFGIFLVVRAPAPGRGAGLSALEDRLRRLILDHGPISVARYMALALAHPTGGYYPRRDPLGAAGDFVTAPEVSQLFGELIGLALVAALARSRPARRACAVVELGPGRGTLMADALRAAKVVPDVRDAAMTSIWSRPARPCASGRRPPCRVCRCAGTTSWPACRRIGRCCWSPTSSWTRCRCGSSCAGPAAGTSAWSASTQDGAFRFVAGDRARRRSRRRSAASTASCPTARCSSSARPARPWSRASPLRLVAQGGWRC